MPSCTKCTNANNDDKILNQEAGACENKEKNVPSNFKEIIKKRSN